MTNTTIKKSALYLIPVTLGDSLLDNVLPGSNFSIIKQLRHFIVEDVRTARRFLKKCDPDFDIDGSVFFVLNQHTQATEIESFLQPLTGGNAMVFGHQPVVTAVGSRSGQFGSCMWFFAEKSGV